MQSLQLISLKPFHNLQELNSPMVGGVRLIPAQDFHHFGGKHLMTKLPMSLAIPALGLPQPGLVLR